MLIASEIRIMKYPKTIHSSLRTPTLRRRAFIAHPLSLNATVKRKDRLLSVGCYFGLAPFLWFLGVVYQRNRLLNHHIMYSLAFSFLILFGAVCSLFINAIRYWYIVYAWNPTPAELGVAYTPYAISILVMTFGSILMLTVWGLAWMVSLIGAIRGQMPQIPLISRIASKPQAINLAVYSSLLVEIILLMVFGLSVRSARITSSMPEKAEVYVLYTVGGYVRGYIPALGLQDTITPPRWIMTMAFYPLVQAGLEKYGEGSVSILPLSEATFNTAIQNGRFIFVASHGGAPPGSFTISELPFKEYIPSDVDPTKVGEQLQYVYFTGCYTGDLESEWRQVLRVETAKMFGRLSPMHEHLLWVWFKSPAVIAGLDN